MGCMSSNKDAEKFKPEYIKSLMIKVTDWQLKNPKHNTCYWHNGALYAGVFAAWETTQSKEIYQDLLEMGNSVNWSPCHQNRFDRCNDVAISQTYMDLYRIEKKQEMIQPTIDTLRKFMDWVYEPKGMRVQKWWWCDALFMEPPTLAKFGVTLNNPEYLEYNDRNFKECYDLLYDKNEHLFFRDIRYVIKNDTADIYESNGKKIFWGRGNGWVLAGLARVLQELPADYKNRPFYETMFKEMSARLISLQPADGMWRTSLLNPDLNPHGEVSASGFICYGLAWGINNGLLDKKTYLPGVKKCWIDLVNCVKEDGCVGWVQPVGGDPQTNFSADTWEVYGTGAFLLAASEIAKLK